MHAADYYSHCGWPKYADRYGFALVFPQTSSSNNAMSCFNWFQPEDSRRGQGEALSVKQMVDYAKAHFGTDPSRIYVTGLSAGGAMTADLLADYPDVFAGGNRLRSARAMRHRSSQRHPVPVHGLQQGAAAVGRPGAQLRPRMERALASGGDLAGHK
ncbi:alpha/beta hydrolase family esterase [Streptomyces sp. NPDC058086]|uniref:alpha/beta hydrolase family esterase n=1 Tax=Streptomyces sp. NPDC058086 TaxID=3346334 RepID=UPI0036E1261E